MCTILMDGPMCKIGLGWMIPMCTIGMDGPQVYNFDGWIASYSFSDLKPAFAINRLFLESDQAVN